MANGFCVKCGRAIVPGTRFCVGCGNPLELPTETEVSQGINVQSTGSATPVGNEQAAENVQSTGNVTPAKNEQAAENVQSSEVTQESGSTPSADMSQSSEAAQSTEPAQATEAAQNSESTEAPKKPERPKKKLFGKWNNEEGTAGIKADALLFPAVFFLVAGTDFFCSFVMGTRKNFLSISEVNGWRSLTVGLSVFFFLLLFFFLLQKKMPFMMRLQKTVVAITPPAFIAALIMLIKSRYREIVLDDISLRKLFSTGIFLLVLVILFLIAFYGAVASQATGETIGIFKSIGILILHLPVALLWFLGWIAVEVILTVIDYLYIVGRLGANTSFNSLMGWRMSEVLCVSAIMWILIVTMQKCSHKWQEKKEQRKQKKKQKRQNTSSPQDIYAQQPAMPQGEQKEEKSWLPEFEPFTPLRLIVTAIFLLASIIMALVSGKQEKKDTEDMILQDIHVMILEASEELMQGRVSGGLLCMQEAEARIDAWKGYCRGSNQTIRDLISEHPEDAMLWKMYITFDEETEAERITELERYVITEGIDNTEARALLLESYAGMKSRDMDEQREDYQRELLYTFMAQGQYVSGLTELPDSDREKEKLAEKLEEDFAIVEAYTEAIKLLDEMGRSGQIDKVTAALSLAEEYPEDVMLQYIAACLVARSAGDGMSHLYDRGIACMERFLALSEADRNVTDEELLARQYEAIEFLIPMEGFDAILALIDKMGLDEENKDEADTLRMFCYFRGGNAEDTYTAALQLINEGSTDPQVWYFYGIGALKQGDEDTMLEAMEEILKTVLDENVTGRELLEAEEVLYIMAEYATINESGIYGTGIFYHEMEDEEQEQLSPILYSYLEAMDTYANGNRHYAGTDMTRYDYARQQIDLVLAERDDLCFAWYLRGCICYRDEDFEGAIEAYQTALIYDSENIPILYSLANAYDGAGRYNEAYATSSLVEELWPNHNHSEDPFGIGFHNPWLRERLESYVNGGEE